METISLNVNRSLLDANFEGYKVSMENVTFLSKKLEQELCLRTPTYSSSTLQNLKIFNSNQLFSNPLEEDGPNQHLYRILATGHIQKISYGKQTRQWDTSIVGKIDLTCEGHPPSLFFTEKNLVVVSNGVSQVTVFLITTEWVEMLNYSMPDGIQGVSLIEARILEDGHLNILLNHNQDKGESKNTVYCITVGLEDIDYAETLTVKKSQFFTQNGHFETCTFGPSGSVIFLSSECPELNGIKHSSLATSEYIWEQDGKTISISFEMKTPIVNEEDIDIDVSKKRLKLQVAGETLFNSSLHGEVDENEVEVCADQTNNSLIIKLKSLSDEKWDHLTGQNEEKEEENQKMETNFGVDGAFEECDEAESSLFFFWIDSSTGKCKKQCNVSGCQVLFIRHHPSSSADFCLRYDVDGIIWNLSSQSPVHLATLHAFGYVLASKTTRFWSGCSPTNNYACIIEDNNRVLLYSQKTAVEGSLSNRKTSTKVTHIAKQYLLKVECPDPIKGVILTDSHLFAATKTGIHVAELSM